MFTTEMLNAVNPTTWSYFLNNQPQNEIEANSPSKMEIAFLLDGGASNFVLSIPNYMMITQMFKYCNRCENDTSKTLTTPNQSAVLFKQYLFATSFSSIETTSINFLIPLAVADFQ